MLAVGFLDGLVEILMNWLCHVIKFFIELVENLTAPLFYWLENGREAGGTAIGPVHSVEIPGQVIDGARAINGWFNLEIAAECLAFYTGVLLLYTLIKIVRRFVPTLG